MLLMLLFFVLILRYLSASEAVWKILQLRITDRSHAVLKLACHLENEQFIVFPQDQPETGLERGELLTTLTAWRPNQTHLIYIYHCK